MADPSTKPASSKPGRTGRPAAAPSRGSRLRVAGKLTALLGLPTLVIGSIFAGGLYVGATRADKIVELEQRWLGVAPPEGRLATADQGTSTDSAPLDPEQPADANTPSDPSKPAPVPADGTKSPTDPNGATKPAPTDAPAVDPAALDPNAPTPGSPVSPDSATASSDRVGPFVVATADPVGAELRSRYEEPRVVQVELLVDPALVLTHPNWLTEIAQLFEATQLSFSRLFGIELQLHGVQVWDAAVGADAAALLADLATPRPGADITLGLVAREQPRNFAATSWTGNSTGDHALVFAEAGLRQADGQADSPHYRNVLRSLARLFGAEPSTDPVAKQLGSFMTEAKPAAASPPVIDPENRGRVIINKRRPLAGADSGDHSEHSDHSDHSDHSGAESEKN